MEIGEPRYALHQRVRHVGFVGSDLHARVICVYYMVASDIQPKPHWRYVIVADDEPGISYDACEAEIKPDDH
jgi:hypothetical protein